MADGHVRPYTTPKGDPRWELRVRVGGRERSRTFDDEKIANKWLAYAKAAGGEKCIRAIDDDDTVRLDSASVRDVVERHITGLSGITDGTRGSYRSEAERDIYPTLGDLPAVTLASEDVRGWVNHLATTRGLSGKTIANRQSLLSAAFTRAVQEGTSGVDTNPCRGVRLPRSIRRPPVFLEPAQIHQLLDEINPFYRDFIVTLVGTGLRWGEATALQVRHIVRTPTVTTIHVEQAWKDVHEGPPVLGPPKSPRSRRSIPVPRPSPVADALDRAIAGRPGDAYVFVGPRGGVIDDGNFHRHTWQPVLDRLGWATRPTIHDLRHTAASLMIAAGAQIEAVSRILGHEKTSTTWDVYGHLVPGARERAMRGLADALGGALGLAGDALQNRPDPSERDRHI